MLDPEPWTLDALCQEYPRVSFFVERGESARPAKAVCARCLVVDDCLDFALRQESSWPGIWGGTSEPERRLLRRPGRIAA